MYRILKAAQADIMLSGGRTQFVALKAKMPWLDINQERHYAYAGYEGMIELVREIDKALSNPVWNQVRTPAPWDEVTWEQRADTDEAGKDPLTPALSPRGEGAGCGSRATLEGSSGVPSPLGERDRVRGSSPDCIAGETAELPIAPLERAA
jgi:nitrogenase molybdenum-cofactor synthesis protein NifE